MGERGYRSVVSARERGREGLASGFWVVGDETACNDKVAARDGRRVPWVDDEPSKD